MRIVLGLGNPGAGYRATRHNIGFWVVERMARKHGAPFQVEPFTLAWTAEVEGPDGPLILAMPRTYMNRSGSAALALCRRHAVLPGELLVVHDDADLELGRLRVRSRGRAGGHNGIRSLVETLGTDELPRVKLGVRGLGRETQVLAEYVLKDFPNEELPVAEALAELAVEAVENVVRQGLTEAMNNYNARLVTQTDRADRSGKEE